MEESLKLSSSNLRAVAKEFTLKAIENHMITPSTDPKKTAEHIALFYKTLVEALNDQVHRALADINLARAFIVSDKINDVSIALVSFNCS